MMIETTEARLKRLKMRSWRRGMKEMDLILGPFGDSELAGMSEEVLQLYDSFLSENDQELYLFVTGVKPAPERFTGLIERIARFSGI